VFDADYFLGRRYSWTRVTAPDVTIVALSPEKGVRLHGADGSRAWLPAGEIIMAIQMGLLVESVGLRPFVLPRIH
jgi:hypothetical protein